MYAWKQVLGRLSFAFDHSTIDLMLFLYKMREDKRFLIAPDALLPFARLIGNGLAEVEWVSSIQVDLMIHHG